MAWLEKNGRRYYYRKRRIGARVKSEYVGTGALAELLEHMDATERRERERSRQQERDNRKQFEDADKALDELANLVRMATRAALIANGYHTHKGTWRKKRNGRNTRSTRE